MNNNMTINNMEIDDIDETNDTSAPDVIQPSSTETLSLKETEKRSSESLIVVSNESIEPVVSRDAENSIRLVEADKCHFMKNGNKLRVKRNNIWSNQKSWRKYGATNSYADRDISHILRLISPPDHSKTNHADVNTIERKSDKKRHSTTRKIVRTNGGLKVNVLDISSYLKSFRHQY